MPFCVRLRCVFFLELFSSFGATYIELLPNSAELGAHHSEARRSIEAVLCRMLHRHFQSA